MRPSHSTISPVRTVSILTVLDRQVDADAFRPSYCDRTQKIYFARNLRRDLLPSLARPVNSPALSEFEGYFRRPWIDVNQFLFDAPVEYMPDYAREIGMTVSYASLLLMLDFTPQQKELLTNYLVQYGIDLFGCLEVGYRGWPGHGGHSSGRKLPIVLAGILLDDARMKKVSKLYPRKFGEDMLTFYVRETPPAGIYTAAWQGATVVYGGYVGITGESVDPAWRPYEHLQPREWKSTLGEQYRRCCTSVAWVGQALTVRLLHAESVWDHPAFFDYVDRWMYEPDKENREEIRRHFPDFRLTDDAWWSQQGNTWEPFVKAMWDRYRTMEGMPGVDGWR